MYKEPETNYEKVKAFYFKNRQSLRRLFSIVAFCFILFGTIHISKALIDRFYYVRRFNSMINQMAQILDNVRALYANNINQQKIMKKLVASGTIPPQYIKNGTLTNMYGGLIILEDSVPMIDSEGYKYPTFKISYQGLSRDICIKMATVNWEGIGSGLISEAVGMISEQGTDTALRDLERDAVDTNRQFAKEHFTKDYVATVAKPNDIFIPIPFSKEQAERGCSCTKNNCTFALRYYSLKSNSQN